MQSLINFWNEYSDDLWSLILKIIISAVIAVIGVLLTKGFNRLILKASEEKTKAGHSAGSILRYVVKYGIVIVCIILILNVFGVNTTSLLAILGAAGLAIGLALKNTLGNIASGIILVFLGTYRSGEFIEFGAVSGTVKDVSLFTTILETNDGLYVSAPNSCIWGVPLRNYSRNGKRRMEIQVRLSCSYSLETAIQLLKEIVLSENRFIKVPSPQIVVQSVVDKNAVLVIQAWADNENYNDIHCQIMKTIKEKMEEAGILI